MDILAESAVRITALSLGVAVVLRVLQIRSPRLVHAAWTAVVVVMLLLPVSWRGGPSSPCRSCPRAASAIRLPAAGVAAAGIRTRFRRQRRRRQIVAGA